MNRSTTITTSLLLTMIAVPLTTLAAMAVEPINGFTSGSRPAWSADHAMSGTPAHIEFHKNAEENIERLIHEEQDLSEQRAGLRTLEREHHEFHNWGDAMKKKIQSRTRNNMMQKVSTPTGAIDYSLVWNDSFKPIFEELRFEGNRPSARLIRDYARSK